MGLHDTLSRLAAQRKQLVRLIDIAGLAQDSSTSAKARAVLPLAGKPAKEWLSETPAFGSNPGYLRMLSYVPKAALKTAGAQPAMVVVLHGCTQTASDYASQSGWRELADRQGFALLCPEQRSSNNQKGCFTWFHQADIAREGGECQSIAQMIAKMISLHSIDPKRVYVTGLSAGGAMACAMLASYPDLFAGGAILAGLPYASASNAMEAFDAMFKGRARTAKEWGSKVRSATAHHAPWPEVSIWHGLEDTTVVPSNADELARQWVDVHGGDMSDSSILVKGGVTETQWKDAQGHVCVRQYLIAGLGHATPIATKGPSACGKPAPFIVDAGISSSARIAADWGLVGAQPLRAAAPVPEAIAVPGSVTKANGPNGRLFQQPLIHNPAPAGQDFVSTTIHKALAAAGLIKR